MRSFVLRASSALGEMEFAPEGWSVPVSYYASHQELENDVRVQWSRVITVGESLTRLRSCCPCTHAGLSRVGIRIECDCPPEDFGWVLSYACPSCPRRARARRTSLS
jgi:hypothetical protein